MCGISGVISLTSVNNDSLIKMNQTIKHRGPDDEGFVLFNENKFVPFGSEDSAKDSWSANELYSPKSDIKTSTFQAKVGFGHRRLAILDLSPKGHQPMCTKDERYWITFNGEVYNYIEIREELKGLGYTFETDSDTEVILNSYKEWGAACQNKFNGMWAFAIYDRINQELLISRDRFGIKPIYYWYSPLGNFYFGSEIKQFTILPEWKAILNKPRALDFLYYSISDHTDETFFLGVNCILPGFCFYGNINDVFSKVQNKLNIIKWYVPEYKKYRGNFEDAKKAFLEKFQNSIKLHLRADVPIGSALSGGLDSSSIVSYVNQLLKFQLKNDLQKTFSSCSIDKRYDEKTWMDEVIKSTNVDCHFVYPKSEDVFKLTEHILWHLDEPYQSQAVFLSNHVFKSAKEKKVIVLLNGQGADEYMAGYGAFNSFLLKQLFFSGKFKSLLKQTNSLMVVFRVIVDAIIDRLPFFFRSMLYQYQKRKHVIYPILGESLKYQKVNHPYLLNKYTKSSLFRISSYQIFKDPLQKYLKWEDRNSMMHSVEARVPFLEKDLVEFTMSLPVEFFIENVTTKKILVESMKGILPEIVRQRKDKKGFITPEERWFKEDCFDDFLKLFKDNVKFSKGLINEYEAVKYFNQVKLGKVHFTYTYWHVIVFCIWMKIYNVEVE